MTALMRVMKAANAGLAPAPPSAARATSPPRLWARIASGKPLTRASVDSDPAAKLAS
jgi:hypothetical protein